MHAGEERSRGTKESIKHPDGHAGPNPDAVVEDPDVVVTTDEKDAA
jgi:hypothetical protein